MTEKPKNPDGVGIQIKNSEDITLKDNLVSGASTGYEVTNARRAEISGNVHLAPVPPRDNPEVWWRRWSRQILIGLIITVGGGLILYMLLGR